MAWMQIHMQALQLILEFIQISEMWNSFKFSTRRSAPFFSIDLLPALHFAADHLSISVIKLHLMVESLGDLLISRHKTPLIIFTSRNLDLAAPTLNLLIARTCLRSWQRWSFFSFNWSLTRSSVSCGLLQDSLKMCERSIVDALNFGIDTSDRTLIFLIFWSTKRAPSTALLHAYALCNQSTKDRRLPH